VISVVLPFSCISVAMWLAHSQVKSINLERRATELEFTARQAALERENAELRVRRELSSILHDHVQQRLVFAASRLQTEVVPLAAENSDYVAIEIMEDIIADIDRLREHEVRQLSHSLFPLGADLGLHQAIALVLGRIPASVEVELTTSESAQAFDTLLEPQWDVAHRAALTEILDEAITNALKHGQARSLWVGLDVAGEGADRAVVLTVTNDGQPLRPDPVLSGLGNHRIKAQLRGGGLNLGQDEQGRTRLVAWLPAAIPGPAGPRPQGDAAPSQAQGDAAPSPAAPGGPTGGERSAAKAGTAPAPSSTPAPSPPPGPAPA
jgi:signal transduction histidine kinase